MITCDDVMYLFFCGQNDIAIHNERLLHSIDYGISYKKWVLKYENSCFATCNSYGYNKLNMIKCVVVKIPINMNV